MGDDAGASAMAFIVAAARAVGRTTLLQHFDLRFEFTKYFQFWEEQKLLSERCITRLRCGEAEQEVDHPGPMRKRLLMDMVAGRAWLLVDEVVEIVER